MRSYRFAVLRSTRKSVTEIAAKNGRNDLISGSLVLNFLAAALPQLPCCARFNQTVDFVYNLIKK